MFMTFKEAASAGSYDELPMLPAGVDPQLHLSRNDVAQPFYLICSKDCTLVQMSGRARIRFAVGSVRYFDAVPGDFVYVPAGAPHRIEPAEPGIQYRYKAAETGTEGVAWYCESCGSEVWRTVWDTASTVPQRGYLEACETFNADEGRRTCRQCGSLHPAVRFPVERWSQIAAQLEAG